MLVQIAVKTYNTYASLVGVPECLCACDVRERVFFVRVCECDREIRCRGIQFLSTDLTLASVLAATMLLERESDIERKRGERERETEREKGF